MSRSQERAPQSFPGAEARTVLAVLDAPHDLSVIGCTCARFVALAARVEAKRVESEDWRSPASRVTRSRC
jgi:hypothetical protein